MRYLLLIQSFVLLYLKLLFEDYLGVFCKDWGTETTSTDKVKRDLSFTDKTKETVIIRYIYLLLIFRL